MDTATALDFDSCYRAVSSRDARFDGLFFNAVRTTGIYCRSVCSARTPKASSCTFYATAAAAERDGYRPCLRCRPELAPGRPDFAAGLAEAVLARVQAGALDQGSVEELARPIGLSSRQIRRILVEHFGVTPIEVAQTQRLLFAKKLLHETGLPMTEIALAAGFGSVRRFNAAFRSHYGMAPSTLRRVAGPSEALEGRVRVRLSYRPPLAWQALLEYLDRRATRGVEAVDARGYWRTIEVERDGVRRIGWINVDAVADSNQLVVTVPEHLAAALMPITLRLRAQFDLDSDPLLVAEHLGRDPLFKRALKAVPGLRVAGAWDPFELALRTVLGQQVSVVGASTLATRLVQRFGTAVLEVGDWPAGLTHLGASADSLARATVDEIAAIGMPGKRAATIIGLARYAAEGGFAPARAISGDERVQELMALPGIGPWTAQYIAMRVLRHPDAFPAGDLGLRKAARADLNQVMPSERELEARSERWRPWRAYAAVYLWQNLRLMEGDK